MIEVRRQAPDPVPAIHPVPEYRAEGRLKDRYEDMKTVLQVPWMGVVMMAYAHYPTFFDTFWKGLRPLCLSRRYVENSRALRRFTEGLASQLDPPPITDRLIKAGYAPRELDGIRDAIEIFSHGNFAYLPVMAAVSVLLDGGALGGGAQVTAFEGRHAPDVSIPLVLMEPHHAALPTRALYEDLKATLGLPFLNTDYRALARWPSYFAMAWSDLRPRVGDAVHERLCQAVHDRLFESAQALPNPGGIDGAALRAAAKRDGDINEVRQVCLLFQWLLPGLVTNMAFFRHQLAGRR